MIEKLREFQTFIFDCDGVLYRGNKPVPAAVRTIKLLKNQGREVKFLTNYPESRATIQRKIKGLLGISVRKEDIMTVAFATREYIRERMSGQRESVFIVGPKDLKREIREIGIETLGLKDVMIDFKIIRVPEWLLISLYNKNDLYHCLTAAGLILKEKNFDPSHYIATSKGKGWTREKGLSLGIGCFIAALQEFSGKKPIVIGKPSNIFMEIAKKVWNIAPKDTVLIGDKWSDIETANENGFFSIKVET